MDLKRIYDALDIQDKKAYPFSDFDEYFEWETKTFPIDKVIMFDQKNTWACTRYAATLISNWQNINERTKNWKQYNQIDPLVIWNRSNKIKSLQAAMDQLYKERLVRAYLWIDRDWEEWIWQIEKAIDFGCFVYTWSSNWDRAKIWKTWLYSTQRKFAGHARGIIWYDRSKKVFNCITSFWPNYGKKWYFDVPYDRIFEKWMYSKHVVVDLDNTMDFVDSIEKQWAKEIVRACKKLYENTKRENITKNIKQTSDLMRETYKFTDNDL